MDKHRHIWRERERQPDTYYRPITDSRDHHGHQAVRREAQSETDEKSNARHSPNGAPILEELKPIYPWVDVALERQCNVKALRVGLRLAQPMPGR